MSMLFITATGTEIGKTFVTCALVDQLRRRGQPVRAIKPVVSGFDPENPADSDCAHLLTAQQQPLLEALDNISPWRFRAPLSPDMAAAAEGRHVPFDAVVRFCRDASKQPDTTLLIEGIGGAMVPLDDRHTVLDWMVALQAPALVVTGSYLGALSHTLTTCAAIAARGVPIQAVVVSESVDNAVNLKATCESLQRFLPEMPIVSVGRLPGTEAWRGAPDLLAAAGFKGSAAAG
jgi:dethiobiotin synthetase